MLQRSFCSIKKSSTFNVPMIRGLVVFKLVFILCVCSLHAQDIHWSQFFNNPLYLSPSEAGNISADYRITGNYRKQWQSVTIPFQTTAIGIDHRLKNKPNIGLGGQFFNDNVGDGKLTTNEMVLSSSYEFVFKDIPARLRPGIQLGFQTRSLNPTAFYFDNQFVNGVFDQSLFSGESEIGTRTFSLNSGLGLSGAYMFNAKNTSTFTLGTFNLNRPNQGFFNQKIKRDLRSNLFVQHTYQYSKLLQFLPALQFSLQGKYKEFIYGTQAHYTLMNRMGLYRAVMGGLWYRNKDAMYISMGFDYQNWRIGLSYDLNVSDLTKASKVRGGIEFSIRYLIFVIKAKKINHRICPEYI